MRSLSGLLESGGREPAGGPISQSEDVVSLQIFSGVRYVLQDAVFEHQSGNLVQLHDDATRDGFTCRKAVASSGTVRKVITPYNKEITEYRPNSPTRKTGACDHGSNVTRSPADDCWKAGCFGKAAHQQNSYMLVRLQTTAQSRYPYS